MKIPEERQVPRLTWRFLVEETLAQFHLEKGLGYTVKKLALAPGEAVYEFLFEDRTRLVRPLPLLALTATLATLISLQFVPGTDELLAELREDEDFLVMPALVQRAIELATYAFTKYFNLMYLSSIPTIAFATWILLSRGLTWTEHLVLNSYMYAIQSVIYLCFLPLILVHPLLASMQFFPMMIWTVFAYRRIFDLTFWPAIGYSALIYLISNAIYTGFAVLAFGIAALFISV